MGRTVGTQNIFYLSTAVETVRSMMRKQSPTSRNIPETLGMLLVVENTL